LLLIAIIFRTMEAFKTFDIVHHGEPGRNRTGFDQALQAGLPGMADGTFVCAGLHRPLAVLAITTIYIKYLNKLKER
jgi:multiple sugar transport system permease protein